MPRTGRTQTNRRQPSPQPSPARADETVNPKPPAGEAIPAWRPEIMCFTSEQFQQLLRNIGTQNQIPNPSFNGSAIEDPESYLLDCETHFNNHQIPEAQWVPLATRQLQGAAASWWTSNKGSSIKWADYRARIIRKFDGPEIKATLQAQLYSQKQANREDAETFIRQKMSLLQRLRPDQNFSDSVPWLLEMLKANLRPFLRCPLPTTLEELILRASAVERDLRATPAENNRSEVMQQANTGHRLAAAPMPPRCHFCPERHFHRDCPVLRNSQQDQSDQQPENWRGPRVTDNDASPRPGPSNLPRPPINSPASRPI